MGGGVGGSGLAGDVMEIRACDIALGSCGGGGKSRLDEVVLDGWLCGGCWLG
jgi:hypothetical protein